jgi:hypothetical protein
VNCLKNLAALEKKMDWKGGMHFPVPICLVCGEVDLNLLVALKRAG